MRGAWYLNVQVPMRGRQLHVALLAVVVHALIPTHQARPSHARQLAQARAQTGTDLAFSRSLAVSCAAALTVTTSMSVLVNAAAQAPELNAGLGPPAPAAAPAPAPAPAPAAGRDDVMPTFALCALLASAVDSTCRTQIHTSTQCTMSVVQPFAGVSSTPLYLPLLGCAVTSRSLRWMARRQTAQRKGCPRRVSTHGALPQHPRTSTHIPLVTRGSVCSGTD